MKSKKPNRLRFRASRALIYRFLFVTAITVLSSTPWSLGQDRFSLGPLTLYSTSQSGNVFDLLPGVKVGDRMIRSKPLKNGTRLASAVSSGFYMSQVGGVAFDAVAELQDGFDVRSIELSYVPRQLDGNRLALTINGQRRQVPYLPDWQLIPIARYADSSFFATVTLFGELEEGHPRPADAQYVVAYHPELQDTLLGLRLFQSDFFLLDPSVSGELPRRNDTYLLGLGEERPEPRSWRPAALALNQRLGAGDRFQSYLICDANVPIRFSASARELQLSGDPYFYFWKRGAPRSETILRDDVRLNVPESFEVVSLERLAKSISGATDLLENANPAVYGTMVTTMRYAAFFRYCKNKSPEAWQRFVDSLKNVTLRPPVTTPVLVNRRTRP